MTSQLPEKIRALARAAQTIVDGIGATNISTWREETCAALRALVDASESLATTLESMHNGETVEDVENRCSAMVSARDLTIRDLRRELFIANVELESLTRKARL
jgi:hypothetical protein